MTDVIPAGDLGRVHLIGVGGVGMSGVARLLAALGLTVSGSDVKQSRALAALSALGVRTYVGHDPAHVADVDTVVISSVIGESNIELAEARRRGLRVLQRAGALASAMDGYTGVAVAGTHGKTTTTSMIAVALQACGADPSFVIGGDLNEPGSNAHLGTGSVFVAEADESDESFLLLAPHVAVVTNVEADHLDHFADLAAVERAFEAFVDRLDPEGFLVTGAEDSGARQVAAHARSQGRRVVTFGADDDTGQPPELTISDITLTGGGSTCEVVWHGRRLGRLTLGVPGRHYVLDAAAALAVCLELGFPFGPLVDGLAGFQGARRRFETKGVAAGRRVVDSYAHHPTELAADIAAARLAVGDGRVVVVFQPHRYSRTQAFAADLGAALSGADVVVVMDVYPAGEAPLAGVSGALVAGAVRGVEVHYEPSWRSVASTAADVSRPGDLILTLGAGDVTMVGPEILNQLQPALAGDSGA